MITNNKRMIMKAYNKIIIAFTLLILAGVIVSCESLEDTYREFTESGETTYIAKADSIVARGGRNRLELSWLLISDPKVTSYKVYWNNREESIEGDVVKTDQVDTVRIMLDNLNEDIYQFDIFLLDQYGNSSIRSSKIGRVYGSKYESSLMNRGFATTKRVGSDMAIEWIAGEEDLHSVELEYQNILNETIHKVIPDSLVNDTLVNFPIDGSITYRTLFLPEPLAIDTFYTESVTLQIPD